LAVVQVLMTGMRPDLPEVLGPQLQELLQAMWRTEPSERPDLAIVLDALDVAEHAGVRAFSDAASELYDLHE
jgi:hypothetical protein